MIKAEGLQILTDLLSKRWDRGIGLKKWFSILCKRKCCGRRSQHQCLWGIEYERTANDNARSRGSLRNGGIVRISRIESLPLRAPKGIGICGSRGTWYAKHLLAITLCLPFKASPILGRLRCSAEAVHYGKHGVVLWNGWNPTPFCVSYIPSYTLSFTRNSKGIQKVWVTGVGNIGFFQKLFLEIFVKGSSSF